MDRDGNGIITAGEIEQLPGPFRDRLMQSGMDFNRGVRVEEMTQNFQRQMEERRQQQDAGGDQRGGFDRGRDRGRREERSDRPEIPPPPESSPDESRGDRSSGRSRSSSNTPSPASSASGTSASSKTTHNRISPYLPDAYKSLDTDFDGQIALYEWRKGKRGTISQFAQYDVNGDGFLIAKELATMTVASPIAATPASTSATPAAPATVVPVVPAAPVTVSAGAAAKASGAFDILDADKNGTVQGTEWDKSTRLKPLFEKGGVDLNQPLTKDQFTQAYVRVGADK